MKIKQPDVPTTGLADLFTHMMAKALDISEPEARIILNLK